MKRFQNRVAESSLSLPVSAIVSILIWLAVGLVSQKLWVPLLLTGFTTYLIAEMNNRNTLLRIRSRMMSCVFLILATVQAAISSSWKITVVQTITALCVFLLLFCYKDKSKVSNIFYISFLISLGSMLWVQVLYILPILIVLMCVPLYAMSIKSISAIVLGLLVPYWALIPYFFYKGNIGWINAHFAPLHDRSVLFNYSLLTIGQTTYYIILTLLLLIGWIHFVRTAYKDKLKTRTLYDVFITLSLFFAAIAPIVPAYADFTLAMLTIVVSPLVAHYFSLTSTKITNIVFIITLAVLTIASVIAIGTPYFNQTILR